MLRRAIPLTVLLALTGAVAATAQSTVASDSVAALEIGQKASDWLWAAEVDSLWAHLDEGTRTRLQSPDNIANQVIQFVGQFGAETTVVSESLARQGENYRYARVVHLEADEEPWTLVWTLAPDLKIMNLDLNQGG